MTRSHATAHAAARFAAGLLAVSLATARRLPAQSIPAETPQAVRDAHAAFLLAFNDGSDQAIRELVRTRFSAASAAAAERIVGYWRALRREVGPLQLVGAERERRGARTSDLFWYRGLTTGAYPGIELALDTGAAPRVRGYGVRRAFRPSLAPRPAATDERQLALALEQYFRAVADSGHFAGAVVITRRGRTVFEGAYGPADIASGRPNALDVPFRLASVTKMFTGAAILRLMDAGRLRLDDPVSTFIPEYPEPVAGRVTIRHLLTHTSGIELDDDSVFYARVSAARSVDELLSLQIERLPHLNEGRFNNFAPLDHYDYSNEGIDLLAAIVERVSGVPWSAYLRDEIFRPAGMRRSGADFLSPVPGIPVGYSAVAPNGGRFETREPVPEVQGAVAALRPAGSGYATARELVAFMRALGDGTLLRPETARLMMSAQVAIPDPPGAPVPCQRSYGFTMVLSHCGNDPIGVGHTGGTLGQSTVVEYFPDSGYTIVILSNFDRVTWWAHTHVLEMLGLR